LGRQPRAGIGREAACCLDGEDHEAQTTGMGRGLGPSSSAAATGGGAVGIDVGAAAATGRGAIGGGGGQSIGEEEARGLGLRARFRRFRFCSEDGRSGSTRALPPRSNGAGWSPYRGYAVRPPWGGIIYTYLQMQASYFGLVARRAG
jgi:hypothetical protein